MKQPNSKIKVSQRQPSIGMFDEVRTVRVDAQNLADDEYLQRKFGVERDSDFPVLARK